MENLDVVANGLRANVLRMLTRAKSGHPGGSLSCIDILCALYFGGVLNYSAQNPKMQGRDRFILSKGHAAPALYATLAHAGFFSESELETLRQPESILQGHPDCKLCPGVEVSTGSLGQGLSISAGLAAGFKLAGTPEAVFCLLGDGECQEGQVWEASMWAAHQKLDNLIAIVDRNRLQIDGSTESVCALGSVAAKFEAFGWQATKVDGHNINELVQVLKAAKQNRNGSPKVIVANTIKGKGVSFMEGEAGWHGKAPNPEQLEIALAELENAKAELKSKKGA